MMMKALASLSFLLPVTILVVGSTQQSAIRIRISELPQRPIAAGTLKITLTEFRGSVFKIGEGWIRVEIENTSSEPVTFMPAHLCFVGKDGQQANILATRRGEFYICSSDRSIAPHARMKEYYELSDKAQLPVDLYYRDKLLAVITD